NPYRNFGQAPARTVPFSALRPAVSGNGRAIVHRIRRKRVPTILVTAPREVKPLAVPELLARCGRLHVVPVARFFDPVVYCAVLEDGSPLYVGRTFNLPERIARHERAFDRLGAAPPSAWAYVPVPGEHAPFVEEYLIRTLRPQLNRARSAPERWPGQYLVAMREAGFVGL